MNILHYQWEFQDPKMEVLYHIFGHILGVYPLTYALYMVGASNQSVPEMAIDNCHGEAPQI